jgi:galactose mutarotase-like enzyme
MTEAILIKSGDSLAEIDVTGGATLTKFEVGNNSVLFPDQILMVNGISKRRGGMPLLFPQAGAGIESEDVSLPQHGFARTSKWNIEEQGPESTRLSLRSSEESRTCFPYDFSLEVEYVLSARTLSCTLAVQNESDRPMPVTPGFHPYFPISAQELGGLRLSLEAFDPLSYKKAETLSYASSGEVKATWPGQPEITITTNDLLKRIMLWGEGGDYFCIEPWQGEANSLLSESALQIQPGEKEVFMISIKVT